MSINNKDKNRLKKSKSKTETKDIITRICAVLKQGNKSITEVAKSAYINWETAQNYLNTLTEAGILEKQTQGKKIIYILLQKQENTLFGLPLDKNKQNITNYIFSKIKQKYKKLHNKEPTRTYIQKTTTEVIKQSKLDIPIVWYLYGQMCVQLYSEDKEYKYEKFDGMKEIDNAINKSWIYDNKNTKEIHEEQYLNNPLYSAKEKLYWQLKNMKNREIFQKEFMFFFGQAIKYNIDENDEVSNVLTDYLSIIIRLDKEGNLQNSKARELFDEIWRFIALKVAFNDLKKDYSKEILNYLMNNRIDEQRTIMYELFSRIFDSFKPLDVDPRLKELQKQVKTKKSAK